MNRIIILLLSFFTLNLSAQNGFEIQEQNAVYFVNYTVAKGETLYKLARDFSIKPTTLMKINAMGEETALKHGTQVKIPLTETNYFKMSGLANEVGYAPLWYQVTDNDSKNSVLNKYNLSDATLSYWNGSKPVASGTRLIVGWLKYNGATSMTGSYPVESKVVKEEVIKVAKLDKTSEQTSEEPIQQNVKEKAQASQSLNPRYIDPNVPQAKQEPVKKGYTKVSKPIEKEVKSIQDDTHEAWYKIKRTTGAQSKEKGSKVEENKGQSTQVKSTPKEYYKTQDTIISVKRNAPITSVPNQVTRNNVIASKDKNYAPRIKEVWTDFKNSLKPKKKVNDETDELPLAVPKPVKNDPDRFVYKERKHKEEKVVSPIVRTNTTKTEIIKSKETKNEVAKLDNSKGKEVKANLNNTTKTVASKTEVAPVLKQETNTSSTTNVKSNSEEKLTEVKVDPVLRNEIQSLSLNKSTSGRAAFFFGGPSGGKFYVATNVASRGQVVKVVNPENGKFVMAEVISALPSSDAAKGILLKLSDNAKLPLGQKNSSFAVKVNY